MYFVRLAVNSVMCPVASSHKRNHIQAVSCRWSDGAFLFNYKLKIRVFCARVFFARFVLTGPVCFSSDYFCICLYFSTMLLRARTYDLSADVDGLSIIWLFFFELLTFCQLMPLRYLSCSSNWLAMCVCMCVRHYIITHGGINNRALRCCCDAFSRQAD